jgi:hypothetical protein
LQQKKYIEDQEEEERRREEKQKKYSQKIACLREENTCLLKKYLRNHAHNYMLAYMSLR